MGAVVFQQAEGVFAEQDDGDEVADGHEAHEEVCQVPDEVEAGDGAEEDHEGDEETVGDERPGLGGEVLDVGFAVVVVAQDAAVGKEEDGDGDGDVAAGANLLAECHLGDFDAVGPCPSGHAAQQDDEGGAGADDEGIAEDADGLYFALIDGVGDICRGGHIGCGAHAGFVAVEAAADALLDGGAKPTGKPLLPTEGVGDDEGEDGGDGGDVHGDDDEGKRHVAQRHDGHDDAADAGDALDAAKDDDEGAEGERDAHVDRRDGKGFFKGLADGVALHRVEGKAKGEDEEEGEDGAHPRFFEPLAHVVGGTTNEGGFAPDFV